MKRKIFTSIAAAALLVCTVTTVSGQTVRSERSCTSRNTACYDPLLSETQTHTTAGNLTQQERTAAELVNRMRRQNGLEPLYIDADLSAKARIKSLDMKSNRYFSHNSPTYGSPFQMMRQLGIRYTSAGENIAMGYTSAEAVVRAWMASDSHRANILSDRYTTIGIGYVDGYWTQWFIR